ncbi:MAG: DUF6116 family protein [Pseudomonadota bacterium]
MALVNPVKWLTGYASRLKFPQLLAVTATLFVVDLVVPDFVPLADELLLGLLTVILASLRERRDAREEADEKEPVS